MQVLGTFINIDAGNQIESEALGAAVAQVAEGRVALCDY